METWAIVTLVLGTSAVSALLTFFITKMQVSHSDKRFEKEHERAIVMYHRERRREVRSAPLLKVRDELARMATMQNRVVNAANRLNTGDGDAKEKATKELQDAMNDWNAYLSKGDLVQTLFIQCDSELFNKVFEIQESYIASYNDLMRYKELKRAEQEKAIKSSGKIWQKVVEVQELINKRLEEL